MDNAAGSVRADPAGLAELDVPAWSDNKGGTLAGHDVRHVPEFPLDRRPIRQPPVHDEVVVECPEREAEEFAKVVEAAMCAAGEEYVRAVPVKVEAAVTDEWVK